MEATKAAASAISTRPFLRSKGIAVLATAATATAVAFKYKSSTFNRNEVDQRTNKAPYGYVAVDRSGGGI